jgi:hypothetical protein
MDISRGNEKKEKKKEKKESNNNKEDRDLLCSMLYTTSMYAKFSCQAPTQSAYTRYIRNS